MAAIEAIIKQLSVPVLKAELSKRGLQVKGKKDELVRILLSAIEEEVGEEVENVEEPMEDDGQDSAVGICLEDEPQAEKPEAEPIIEDQPAETEDTDEPVTLEEESKAPDSSCDIGT